MTTRSRGLKLGVTYVMATRYPDMDAPELLKIGGSTTPELRSAYRFPVRSSHDIDTFARYIDRLRADFPDGHFGYLAI